MDIAQIVSIVAAFLCTLVAGFLFAWAVVVMPGLTRLADREFIRAFQVMDRVIQDNQPVFVFVWVGSVLAVVAAAVLGFGHLDRAGGILVVIAAVAYLLGVQLPTIAINVPLNNKLQALKTDAMDESALRGAREGFEPRWNRSNVLRTMVASLVSVLLLVVLIRF